MKPVLHTEVGLAVAGIVLGGALFGAIAVVKVVLDGIDKGCRTIGR